MNIREHVINYKKGVPFEASVCAITREEPHFHSASAEFVLCLKGSVTVCAGNLQAVLKQGEILSMDFRDVHYLYSDEPNLVLIFHLELRNLPVPWESIQCMFLSCDSMNVNPHQKEHLNYVISTILSLSRFYMKYDPADDLPPGFDNAVKQFTETLYYHFNAFAVHKPDNYVNEELSTRFHNIIRYCFDHSKEKISAAQLAEQEHISRTYLSQFMSSLNWANTFKDIVNYIRCYEAEQYLLLTDKTNLEICYECGFSDPKYYYSAFRKIWGCTPSEHRNRVRKYMEHEKKIKYLSTRSSLARLNAFSAEWHMNQTFER